MHGWVQITLVAASAGILVLLLISCIQRYWCRLKRREFQETTSRERAENLQTGISRLHHVNTIHHHLDKDNSRRRTNYYVLRRGSSSSKPLFSWADHPSLVTDAVEHGWSHFAFTSFVSSPSVRSSVSLLGACGAGDFVKEMGVEISWEVCQGSSDFIQKIRLNSGLKKMMNHSNSGLTIGGASSVIKTTLPIPGPPLGNSSFPQEAYFEITILGFNREDGSVRKVKSEGEKVKLIQDNSDSKSSSESLMHVISTRSETHGKKKFEELKVGNVEDKSRVEAVTLSLGLTVGGNLPLKLPGSYRGSIGFNSDGSVFLDGLKLVFESKKEEWGRTEKVIGCGYNPRERKVFFTVDSQLMHVIHCKTEEFGTPLYPTLAANSDILVLVNFGQIAFKYSPANAQRTPNPCFIGPLSNSPALGYDVDSKELFSMGRIDSQWLNRSATRNASTHHNNSNSNKSVDFDDESEGDLFEIVLDSCGRSPNPVSS